MVIILLIIIAYYYKTKVDVWDQQNLNGWFSDRFGLVFEQMYQISLKKIYICYGSF